MLLEITCFTFDLYFRYHTNMATDMEIDDSLYRYVYIWIQIRV